MKPSLTPEAMRVKIAEACGIKALWAYSLPHRVVHCDVPDYCNDLNACHEMEKVLNRGQRALFRHHLGTMFPRDEDGYTTGWEGRFGRSIHATALQRCEAFIATLGLVDGTEGEK